MWIMRQLLLIATGGALGAMTRFLALSSVTALFGNAFPYGTLVVNVVGSFFAGIVSMLILDKGVFFSAHTQSLILVGFLGAFTTFSTFSMETLLLMQEAQWLKAVLNITLNLTLCLLASFLGIYLVRELSV